MLFTRMHSTVRLPTLATPDSVGADIYAFLRSETGKPITMLIPPGATRMIPTGLVARPEPGYFIMVCSRSGLATKSIFVTNSPGIIDPDYRGEIKVLLYNGSLHESQWIKDGDRIAQLIETPALVNTVRESPDDLRNEVTQRGADGFGSSGR